MSTKRGKQHKSTTKNCKKTGNAESEVFVLPPDLLEKLGINLGNLHPTQHSVTQNTEGDFQVPKPKKENDEKDVSENSDISESSKLESSFIQTATLMKESVFLSPTFVSNPTDAIAAANGELEISNEFINSEDISNRPLIYIRNNNDNNIKMQQNTINKDNKNDITLHPSLENENNIKSQANFQKNVSLKSEICLEDISNELVIMSCKETSHIKKKKPQSEVCSEDTTNEHDDSIQDITCNESSPIEKVVLQSEVCSEVTPNENDSLQDINCKVSNPDEDDLSKSKICLEDITTEHIVISCKDSNCTEETLPKPEVYSEDTSKELNIISSKDSFPMKEVVSQSELCLEAVSNVFKSKSCKEHNPINESTSKSEVCLEVTAHELTMISGYNSNPIEVVLEDPTTAKAMHASNVNQSFDILCKTNMFQNIEQIATDHTENFGNEINTKKVNNILNEKKNKITIISQEIVSLQQFTETNIVNKSCLISVPINTVISAKKENYYKLNTNPKDVINVCNNPLNKTNQLESMNLDINVNSNSFLSEQEGSLQIDKLVQNLVVQNDEMNNQIDNVIDSETNPLFFNKTIQNNPNDHAILITGPIIFELENKTDPIMETSKIYLDTNSDDIIYSSVNTKTPKHSVSFKDHITLKSISDNAACDFEPSDKYFVKGSVIPDVPWQPQVNDNLKMCNIIKADSSLIDHSLEQKEKLSPFSSINKSTIVGNLLLHDTEIGGPATIKECIQGIEKPGGEDVLSFHRHLKTQLKTYHGAKHRPRKVQQSFNDGDKDIHIDHLTDTKLIDAVNLENKLNCNQKYCTCADFGRLSYYSESNKPYEHLHFWNSENIPPSDPLLIFSILYDFINHSIDTKYDVVASNIPFEDDSEVTTIICWNEIHNQIEIDNVHSTTEVINYKNDRNYTQNINANKSENSNINHKKESGTIHRKLCNNEKNLNLNSNMLECEVESNVSSEQSIKVTQNAVMSTVTYNIINKEKVREPDIVGSNQISLSSKTIISTHERGNEMVSEINNITETDDSMDEIPCVIVVMDSNPETDTLLELQDNNVPANIKIVHGDDQDKYTIESKDVESEVALKIPNKTYSRFEKSDDFGHIDKVCSEDSLDDVKTAVFKCGVCKCDVKIASWMTHIEEEHNYLSWKHGDTSVDLKDDAAVKRHLESIITETKILTCSKCGIKRSNAKSYLKHLNKCKKQETETTDEHNTIESSEPACEPTKSSAKDKSMKRLRTKSNKFQTTVDSFLTDHNTSADMSQVCSKSISLQTEEPRKKLKAKSNKVGVSREISLADHNNIGENSQLSITAQNSLEIEKPRKEIRNSKKHSEDDSSMTNHNNSTPKSIKRKKSLKTSNDTNVDETSNQADMDTSESPSDNFNEKLIKCGVCKKEIDDAFWFEHIGSKHNYLAWVEGDTILNVKDEGQVRQHLYCIKQIIGGLTCSKCKCKRKYVKAYQEHIKTCTGLKKDSTLDSSVTESNSTADKSQLDFDVPPTPEADKPKKKIKNLNNSDKMEHVTCGRCKDTMKKSSWIRHIQMAHNYLAWKEGEPELDLNDDESLWQYLQNLRKELGELKCPKCKSKRKYAKLFLEHVRTCTVTESNIEMKYTNEKDMDTSESQSDDLNGKSVKCGVCKEDFDVSQWFDHIGSKHNYLAWVEGDPILNVKDEEEVRQHLYGITKLNDGLICFKCKCKRKYVKAYQEHIKTCTGVSQDIVETEATISTWFKESLQNIDVKCGVCEAELKGNFWLEHAQNTHNYLTWIEGEPKLNVENEQAVLDHLLYLSRQLKELTCFKCGITRKHAKYFLAHIKTCEYSQDDTWKEENSAIPDSSVKEITCGVCKQIICHSSWWKHIEKEHIYLAWIDGKPKIDIEDDECVRQHLYTISKLLGGLTCARCNTKRKYVKWFMSHIKVCKGESEELDEFSTPTQTLSSQKFIKCGVCSKTIKRRNWFNHIQIVHEYIAWEEEHEPVVINNSESVLSHLNYILQHVPCLTCPRCGFSKRTAKAYMPHINTCKETLNSEICEDKKSLLLKNEGLYECAMCHIKVKPKEWKNHAMDEHYNIAWVVGDVPIDLKKPYGTDVYLKEYKEKKGRLECRNCGATRASLMGFYVHIITCGKTEEETAPYKDDCDICGNKYLSIYKSQHMTMHKEKELALQRKEQKKTESAIIMTEPEKTVILSTQRRKAAEKANMVLQTSLKNNEDCHQCVHCDFSTDCIKDFTRHKCRKGQNEEDVQPSSEDESESDLSVVLSDEEEVIKVENTDSPIKKKSVSGGLLLFFLCCPL